MKRICFVFMFLNCVFISVFSDEDYNIRKTGYYHNGETAISFSEYGRIVMQEYDRQEGRSALIREGRYSTVSEHGIPFININWDDSKAEKYLFLFYGDNSRILLYNSDSEPFFNGKHWDDSLGVDELGTGIQGGELFAQTKISATSSLNNGAVVYSSDISNLAIGKPWVEGVEGQGVGEKLTFSVTQMVSIYISIGFISYNRPNLYSQNSRPSKIKVNFQGNSFFADLADTPHFQKIEIPQGFYRTSASTIEFEFEIADIYLGARWPDTCVNSILYHFSQ